MVFEPLHDVKLNLKKDTPLVTRYKKALEALIEEMRRDNKGINNVILQDGRRCDLGVEEQGYEFPYESEETLLFEGATVTATVFGAKSEGRIQSVGNKRILISLRDDFGPHISTCILKIDNTAMLEALAKRMEAIENGKITSFNTSLAESVMRNTGEERTPQPVSIPANEKLNKYQNDAIEKILVNDVFYLWGPPGTGKTRTLTPLCRHLYKENQRILICSNTNQAVDQVLLHLCNGFGEQHEAILQGHIIRHGKITHSELENKWSYAINIDRIVERKSQSLVTRKELLEHRINAIDMAVAQMQDTMNIYNRLDVIIKDIAALDSEYDNEKKAIAPTKEEIATLNMKVAALDTERLRSLNSNVIMRVLNRSVESIDRDIKTVRKKLSVKENELNTRTLQLRIKLQNIVAEKSEKETLERTLIGTNRRHIEATLEKADKEKQPLLDDITEINIKLADIKRAVLMDAKIVGATVTKVHLSSQLFDNFDTVIIDEASMVMLPALFNAAGLAKQRVVISGDYRQLTPIVMTNQKEILLEIGKDVFRSNGLDKGKAKRLAMLQEQHRMAPPICDLISKRLYKGKLMTSLDTKNRKPNNTPTPFNHALTIIDMSSVSPFVHKDAFRSRYNIMNALAVRNICKYFLARGVVVDDTSLGVCTPYSAQAKILETVIKVIDRVKCATVHVYQGDERQCMILDIPDSVGEARAGYFLQASTNDEVNIGVNLFNVAISRAKDQLIVFANLLYLDKKLPERAFLRDILAEMQEKGRVIDVREVLNLYPIVEDLRRYGQSFDLSPAAYGSGLFNQNDFEIVCLADMEKAKKGIAVFSGFVTPQRVRKYESLFRTKTAQGVTIRCVTRPPKTNGNIPPDQATEALDALESMGCIVDTRGRIHEKAVIIDGETVWFGSLNPLSHTDSTSEVMARFDDGKEFARQLAIFMSLDIRSSGDSKDGNLFVGENPRCPNCGARSAHMLGKYGAYWMCERCDWKRNVIQHRVEQSHAELITDAPPKCEQCGMPMVLRSANGRPFYGCSGYPTCVNTQRISDRHPKHDRPFPQPTQSWDNSS